MARTLLRQQSEQTNRILVIIALIFSLVIASLFLTTAVTAVHVQRIQAHVVQAQTQLTTAQHHWAQLQLAEQFQAEADYLSCIATLEALPKTSEFWERTEGLKALCYDPLALKWFAEADEYAAQDRLNAAIQLVSQIQGGSWQAEAQQRIQTWSAQIISIAERQYFSPTNQFDAAIQIAQAIEPDNALYDQAQAKINAWQEDWRTNQQSWYKARAALSAGNLEHAQQHIAAMTNHPFWNQHREEIVQAISEQTQIYEASLRQASQYIDQHRPQRAQSLLAQLPPFEPWQTQKMQLLAEIEQHIQQNNHRSRVQLAYLVILAVVGVLILSLGMKRAH